VKRIVVAVVSAVVSASLIAATHSGFGLDAFNRSISAATRGNAVFSPFSFEVDSVVFSEAFDALTRAKYAEAMGVLNGLESVYQPIYEDLATQNGRGLLYLHARAFCVSDERKTHPAYRRWMQKTFSTEMFSVDFRKGAECWFRSCLDGEMEDFTLPEKVSSEGCYSFYDLVSFHCEWKDPFPTNNTREIKFQLADGTSRVLPGMCDLRLADCWVRNNVSILRLPMADSAWFFAILPREGLSVRDIRGELSSSTIVSIVKGIQSVTEDGVLHAAVAVVIPKMDIVTESDLKLPFAYFGFPMTEMERMEKDIRPKFVRQRTRFHLDEKGNGGCVIGEKPSDQVIRASHDTVRFILNRPFLFFVHHERTSTIPVAGQFTGM